MPSGQRFEHTEPWGFSPEASGIRTRPDLEKEIASIRLQELDAPDTQQHITPLEEPAGPAGTALLGPMLLSSAKPTSSTAPLKPTAAPLTAADPSSTAILTPLPAPRPTTQPLTRPIRAVSSPPPPAGHRSTPPPPAGPPLEAAVQASVYASVQAVLVAASHLSKSTPPPPPAPVATGWTPAQRVYVLATAVALSVMATTIAFLVLGSPSAHGAVAPRAAHAPSALLATLDTSSGASATRKDPSALVAVPDAPAPAPRRAFPAGRSTSSSAVSMRATTAEPSSSAAKLDDAARSAKMLREQLNTAVN